MGVIVLMTAVKILLKIVLAEESSILASSTGVQQETNDSNCLDTSWSWRTDCLIDGNFKSLCECKKAAYTTITYDYPEYRVAFTQPMTLISAFVANRVDTQYH